jgi:hypothetical protein
MQPTYLPWLGYFELMANSDCFVLFDDVQFEKKSWQQRNRIKTSSGELMLIVPVKTSGVQYQKINGVLIDNNDNWKRKHLKSIEVSYRKAPYFDKYFSSLQKIYNKEYLKLADLNFALIEFIKGELKINTPIKMSSEIPTRTSRDEKIIDICKAVNADELYDAAGAEEILDRDKFEQEKIKLVFQKYDHPEYQQMHGDFVPFMSALDLLFNEGENSLKVILSGAK